jgi:hypothetical protein
LEDNVRAANGQIYIITNNLISTSAYQLVITPAREIRGRRANRYDAGDADTSGDARTSFIVTARDNGFYQIRLRYSAGPVQGVTGARIAQLALNGEMLSDLSLPATMGWEQWADRSIYVFLTAGINRLEFGAAASEGRRVIAIDSIELSPVQGPVNVYDVGDANNRLMGTASLVSDPAAPGGSYVSGVGSGQGNTLEFHQMIVPANGVYRMVVHFSNGEFRGGHSYNSQVVDRCAEISANGGEPQVVYFRNTFSWNNYQTRVVDVELKAGDNTILFSNSASVSFAPNIARIEIAPKILS